MNFLELVGAVVIGCIAAEIIMTVGTNLIDWVTREDQNGN